MGLFKSNEEKKKETKDRWMESTEYKLGVSFEEYEQLTKEFTELMTKITGSDKIFRPHEAINSLFSDLNTKQKVFIHLYSITVARGS